MDPSQVEKYEKILAADPTSTAFVELARALLAAGDLDRAAAVCRAGIERHPAPSISIEGLFLWGKALLLAGQPGEAMERFGRATGIEPENPLAYNLIAELLIQRKLYRSALPILRKATELQPTNDQLWQWLDLALSATPGGMNALGRSPPASGPSSRIERPAPETPLLPDWAPPNTAPVSRPVGPSEDPASSLSVHPPTRAGPPPLPPARSSQPSPPLRQGPGSPPRVRDLLGDLPDALPEPAQIVSTPGMSRDEAQRIADRYESDLREGYLQKRDAAPPSWRRRHWLAATLAGAVIGAGGAGVGGTLLYRHYYNQLHQREFLSRAEAGLLEDSEPSLTGASHQLAEALETEPGNPVAGALAAQASATLFRGYGGPSTLRDHAAELLKDPRLSRAAPDPYWTARFMLSFDPTKLQKALLTLPAAEAGPWVHYLAGRLLLEGGDTPGGLARFDAALKAAPAHVPTLLAVGDYYLGAADPSRAAELFGLAHVASPLSVGGAVGLAEAHLALGVAGLADEQALAAAETGGGSDPAAREDTSRIPIVPIAWRERLDLAAARVLALEGKFEPAIARLRDGLGQHADEVVAYAGALADVLALDGRFAEAEIQARRVVEREPHDPAALERLGRILQGRQRYKELLARVPAESPKSSPGSAPSDVLRSLHVLRARADLALGECQAAQREVEATRRGERFSTGAAVVLALCEVEEGHLDRARQTLEPIAALAHPSATALLALAELAGRADEPAKALARDREAVAADPRGYETHCALGRRLLAMGQTREGRDELQRSIALNHEHPEAHVALGLSDLAAGEEAAAAVQIGAAVQEAPWDSAAQVAKARLLAGEHRYAEALRAASRAAAISPRSADAHRWRGEIAQAAGQHALAGRELRLAKRLDRATPMGIGHRR